MFNQKDTSKVSCFEGQDCFSTSIRVLDLAAKLGLEVKERFSGTFWIAFLRDGEPISNVSFFQPSHAYAFLLGVEAMMIANSPGKL